MEVVAVNSNNYTIRDEITNEEMQVHVDRLKIYYGLATDIFVDHYVVISQTVTIYPFVDWTDTTRNFLTGIQFIAQPFSAAYGIGCLWNSVNAHDKLVLFCILPVCVCVAVGLYYIVGSRSAALTGRVKANCVGILLKCMPTLLAYMVGRAVSVLRPCHEIAGTSYMYDDYSVMCDTKHNGYRVLAGIAITAVVVLTACTFLRMRRFINRNTTLTKTGRRQSLKINAGLSRTDPKAITWEHAFVILTENYHDERWYWRFVDFLRVLLLTAAIEVAAPDTSLQLGIAVVISFVFFCAQAVFSTFKGQPDLPNNNRMYYMHAMASVQFVLTFALILDSGRHDPDVNQSLLGVFVSVCLIFTALLPYLRYFREDLPDRIREVRGRRRGLRSSKDECTNYNPTFTQAFTPHELQNVSADNYLDIGGESVAVATQSASLSMQVHDDISVGMRCSTSKYGSGIVRYIGNFGDNVGVRIGIELDQPLGRNDGTAKNGERYFKCASKHGIYVKPSAVEEEQNEQKEAMSEFGF